MGEGGGGDAQCRIHTEGGEGVGVHVGRKTCVALSSACSKLCAGLDSDGRHEGQKGCGCHWLYLPKLEWGTEQKYFTQGKGWHAHPRSYTCMYGYTCTLEHTQASTLSTCLYLLLMFCMRCCSRLYLFLLQPLLLVLQ